MDKKDKSNHDEGDQDRTQAFDSDKTEISSDQADNTVEMSESNSPSPIRLPEISGFKILKILGKGGMGVVYEAEQQNPKRKVALKVMLHGKAMDDLFVRMFEREVETLARLTHPNIGGIYESGRTKEGQYYFAMEIVKGETLDEYLHNTGQKKELTTSDIHNRLLLFKKIVNAVHYAHQRGVIHRDLKPNNIVVVFSSDSLSGSTSNIPEIKILDFGLARITDTDVQMTQVSEIGTIKGTLAYMSPEQARGNPNEIDVRSDVYSLGVILYQMLSRKLPKQIPGSMLEALRVITEIEAKPLSEVFQGKKRLDSDIATICHKALELNADDRYDSASAMSDDIERYLSNQPIQARPPSTIYQLRKMIKRNKLTTAFVGIVFILLIGVSVVMSILRSETEKARADAVTKADELQIVTKFQSSMLSDIDAETMGLALYDDLRNQIKESLKKESISEKEIEKTIQTFDKTLKRANATNVALTLIDKQVLERAVKTIDKQFADQPEIKASLKQTVGETYGNLGFYDEALPLQQEALEIRRRLLGNDNRETLNSISSMGSLLEEMGIYDEAFEYYQEALEGNQRLFGDEYIETLKSRNNIASILRKLGKYDEALILLQKSLVIERRVLGNDHLVTLHAINDLGIWFLEMGKLDEALVYLREALDIKRRTLGNDNPETLSSINNIGVALGYMGKIEEALVYIMEALEGERRVLGDDHPSTLASIFLVGSRLQELGEYEKAVVYIQEALEGDRRILGDDHPNTLNSINSMGHLLTNMGKFKEAMIFFEEALAGYRRVLGENNIETLRSLNYMGMLLSKMGKDEEALVYYQESLRGARKLLGDEHPNTLILMGNIGGIYHSIGQYDEAYTYYKESVDGLRTAIGSDNPSTLLNIGNIGKLLDDMGKYDEALIYYLEAIDGYRNTSGEENYYTINVMKNLGGYYVNLGKYKEAIGLLAPAEANARLAFVEGNSWRLGVFLSALGGAHSALGEFTKADNNLNEAFGLLVETKINNKTQFEKLLQRIVKHYTDWNKVSPNQGYDQEAVSWKQKLLEFQNEIKSIS